MSFARRFFKNTAWLSLGQLSNVFTSFLWVAIIARYIGPELYGIYGYSFSVASLLLLMVNFGFDQYIVLNISKNKNLTLILWKKILKYKLYAIPIYLICLTLLSFSKNWSISYILIFYLVAVPLVIEALTSTIISVFHSHQLMQYDVWTQLIKSFFVLIFAVIGVQLKFDFSIILLLNFLAFIIRLSVIFILFKKIILNNFSIQTNGQNFNDLRYIKIIKDSFPLFLLSIVSIIYSNLVILIVEWLNSPLYDLGVFVAATRLQGYVLLLPSVLHTVITPSFSSLYSQNIYDFKNKFIIALKILYFFSYILAIIVSLNSELIVHIVYGSKFEDAVPLFAIQALMLIGGPGYLFGSTMLIINKQYVSLLFYLVALLVVICFSVIFVPQFGVIAASWAMVSGVVAGQIVYPFFIFKTLKIKFPVLFFAKVIFTSLFIFLIGSGAKYFQLNLYIQNILIFTSFIILFFSFGYLKEREFNSFIDFIFSKFTDKLNSIFVK